MTSIAATASHPTFDQGWCSRAQARAWFAAVLDCNGMLQKTTGLFSVRSLALGILLTALGGSLAACSGTSSKLAPATPTLTVRPTVKAPVVDVVDVAGKAATLVAAADREQADRKLDVGRHPAELLAFLKLPAGARVAEISAGTGYTTELLARAVGPTGIVYGQNNAFVIEKFAAAGWAERLAKPINKNVVRVDRELDAPLPSDATNLDSVVIVLFYHDTVWMKTDRAKMNRAIFDALRPGGSYVVVDHATAPGRGIADVSSLHRIDEQTVRSEITAAGFEVAAEASFLRNATDQHDWNASPGQAGEKRGSSDRFVLKFVKPIKHVGG